MTRPPVLAALLVVLAACTTISEAEVAAATLWFPPQVKRTDEPRFCFSPAERKRALQEYRVNGSDTLFELVIDAEGKVKKARLLRTHVDPVYHDDMLRHARWLGFSADPRGAGYRAFFYPTEYTRTSTFEWIEPG